jgi:hypothetical protein
MGMLEAISQTAAVRDKQPQVQQVLRGGIHVDDLPHRFEFASHFPASITMKDYTS